MAHVHAAHDIHNSRRDRSAGLDGVFPAVAGSARTLAITGVLALALLTGACAAYPAPGSYSPIQLFCPGNYDPEADLCTLPVDFGAVIGP